MTKEIYFFIVECEIDTSNDNFDEVLVLPNSGRSNDSGSDDEVNTKNCWVWKACKNYTEDQTKLEKDHEYNWIDGELCYPDVIDDVITCYWLNLKKNIFKYVSLYNYLKNFFLLKWKVT